MAEIVKVCVTGASGKAGRAAVDELASSGFDVLAVDLVPAALGVPFLSADLCDYGPDRRGPQPGRRRCPLGQHFRSGHHTPAVTFTRNTEMNANVFLGAAQVGLQRVV